MPTDTWSPSSAGFMPTSPSMATTRGIPCSPRHDPCPARTLPPGSSSQAATAASPRRAGLVAAVLGEGVEDAPTAPARSSPAARLQGMTGSRRTRRSSMKSRDWTRITPRGRTAPGRYRAAAASSAMREAGSAARRRATNEAVSRKRSQTKRRQVVGQPRLVARQDRRCGNRQAGGWRNSATTAKPVGQRADHRRLGKAASQGQPSRRATTNSSVTTTSSRWPGFFMRFRLAALSGVEPWRSSSAVGRGPAAPEHPARHRASARRRSRRCRKPSAPRRPGPRG